MGARASGDRPPHEIQSNHRLMRDVARHADLVQSAPLGRASRLTALALSQQRSARGRRMLGELQRTETRDPPRPRLARSLDTIGAGYASREVLRGTPQGARLRQWAEGVRARVLLPAPWSAISADMRSIAEHPRFVRSLLEIGADTDWLDVILRGLVTMHDATDAVRMMVRDMPRRAPASSDTVFVSSALYTGHFATALVLIDAGYPYGADALRSIGLGLGPTDVCEWFEERELAPEVLRRWLERPGAVELADLEAVSRADRHSMSRIGERLARPVVTMTSVSVVATSVSPSVVSAALARPERPHLVALWLVCRSGLEECRRSEAPHLQSAWVDAARPAVDRFGPLVAPAHW